MFKRKRELPTPKAQPADSTPKTKVRFGEVHIRTHSMELWGGGGVPQDDGPPLGLSFDVIEERSVQIEEWENERENARTPKDAYCAVGCVEPMRRAAILMRCGSTLKQIRTVKQAVARLNKQRWQATAMLYEDNWLFSMPHSTDSSDLLAMLGPRHEAETICLDACGWTSAEAFAASLGGLVGPDELLPAASPQPDWDRLTAALQGCWARHAVLLVHCGPREATTAAQERMLGQFVGCVASALVACNSRAAAEAAALAAEGGDASRRADEARGSLCVVLQGWCRARITAQWPSEETQDYALAQLK